MIARHRYLAVRRSRQAFSLIELMIALGLFATIALVAGKAFHFTFRTMYRVDVTQTAITQWEQAQRTLRQDVWAASSVQTPNETTAVVDLGGGQTATWSIDDANALTRVVNQNGQERSRSRWPELLRSTRFGSENDGLIVTATAKGHATETTRYSSAKRLMEGPR